MSKPFSDADLSTQLSQDLTWRLREISDLKLAIRTAAVVSRPVLLRSLIAISYAHWEGHVRNSAQKYLLHVALRRFTFSQLQPQFLKSYFLPRLTSAANSNVSAEGWDFLQDEILSAGARQFSRVNEGLVNTRSNLNFETFSDICRVCGVNSSAFQEKQAFIDVILLKRRNSIAHGEDTLISFDELNSIADITIGLMRQFSDDLQNLAVLRSYKAA